MKRNKKITKIKNKQMRSGFSFIELILIIIIIGILAAVAIPKLAATRDDAALSTDVSNMAICLQDASGAYTSRMEDYNEENTSIACASVICYNIRYAVNGEDFNVTTNPNAANFCRDIDYVGGHLAKSYDFGGSTIKR